MKMYNKVIGCSALAAAALFVSVSTSQAAANLLVNPGFETSPGGFTANPVTLGTVNQGWATFGNSAQNDMASSPDSPYSGAYSLLEVNGVGNAWNPAGAYQIIADSSAGATWSASIWALTDTGVQGAAVAGTGPVIWQVQFLDSNLLNISTVDTGWQAINSLDTWQQYTIGGIVPAGTSYISAYAMAMIGPGNTGDVNVYYDDAVLTVVPEPSTLALAGLGGVVSLFLARRRKS